MTLTLLSLIVSVLVASMGTWSLLSEKFEGKWILKIGAGMITITNGLNVLFITLTLAGGYGLNEVFIHRDTRTIDLMSYASSIVLMFGLWQPESQCECNKVEEEIF